MIMNLGEGKMIQILIVQNQVIVTEEVEVEAKREVHVESLLVEIHPGEHHHEDPKLEIEVAVPVQDNDITNHTDTVLVVAVRAAHR